MSGDEPPAELSCRIRQIYRYACAGVIGVAVTGLLLDNPSREHEISSGWWQAFAACTVQCIAGSTIFVLFAKGNRLFGSDQDS